MMRLRFTILFISLISIATALQAQTKNITVKGKVIDGKSEQPVEFATVVLKDKNTEKNITGKTTAADGTFEIKTDVSDFYVEVSFIGFETKAIKDISIANGMANLGTIAMGENEEVLEELLIVGERSTTEFELDKKVFNVGKDLSSAGGSAFDVLNNVPSVNVNIEGEISLRGSTGVEILINGKPSVLTSESGSNALGTITADMIEKIEVITNPSAKYNAEGTSGIINIVIKKEERKGTNGSVSINTGVPHNHSLGLSLNHRTEKFNLFSQVGAGYRNMPNESRNINTDLGSNTSVISNGEEDKYEQFYNFSLGTDYYINPTNVLTLSGNFAYEIEDQPSTSYFSSLDENNEVVSEWNRDQATSATNPKWQYELQYKSDFKDDEDHVLLFSATGSHFGKDQSSEYTNVTTYGENVDSNQQTDTDFKETEYTFKLDYTKPFLDKFTLETGGQYNINDVGNDYSVSNLEDGTWVVDPDLSNVFEYHQNVLALYGTGAYEGDKWGLKLGLRVETTDLNTVLKNTGEENNQNYTNLFPSVHTSYKLTNNFSVQAGFSKRILRPRLWNLNPFFNISNNYSIRTGNPDLRPEYTDSYELAAMYIVDKISWNVGVYHRYTTDVVERISTFEDNVNISKPYNIGTNRATGVELNGKYLPANWLSITGEINYNYYIREGSLETTSFDFDADQWTSKVTTKFKFPLDIDFEVTGHYQSEYQTVQSIISNNLFADMGVRKKILKGRGVINMSVRDIFASRRMETITNQSDFYLYSYGKRGRFVTLGFSFGFGKGEAMEFSGQKMH
ncbi:outer membrane beta-barrel family protein [Chondrinema litorale]|uniref:outer membrane beta-barrel family protein n=1 Tax=Chondrinema litorale TaxID=2994555 RepID=UPI002542A374|nr:outer membrane beta-barrel family protein [Chondrinema litorale]UZR97759.1 outer membrane beta-barrel family protein [Chondrinema litorale]